jgi:dihydrofolate synthase/folylpolyglutamate synthase
MNYKEFLEYIYQRHSGNVKLGLDRMLKILKKMGNPNGKLNGIHIAGTNGKGSTAAMCEAMSLTHNIKTGLNTSPHLVDYRERIRINGKNIKLNELMKIYQKWQSVFEENEASFFEITTSMAFYHFVSKQVDNAIFEVGLGGRLDGTNPFKATVTAITSISYDHPKSLGESIEQIAREKAGIIKKNTPLIIGKMSYKARNILKQIARDNDSQIYEYGKDFTVSNINLDISGTIFDYFSNDLVIKKIKTNLPGKHQAYNAAVAIASFLEFFKKTNRNIDISKIKKALNKVQWQGRMQILSENPLVIIDGAHNVEGVKSLTHNLTALFPDKRILFVLAILRDKNLREIIKCICSISYKVYISKNKSTRAAEIEDQVKYVKKNKVEYEAIYDVVKAVKKALQDAKKDDIVIISGSLFTISEVLKAKKKLFN